MKDLKDYKASHPSRVRGLKYQGEEVVKAQDKSHPSRVRGLKS